jgi:CheY-like chemotaxis protein
LPDYVLIVEDDRDLREALALDLTMEGYEVRCAGNGVEGLAMARRERPMLILTDLEMPVMNGRVMLQHLRDEPTTAALPVIVLSAFGFEWEAELMGAQGYIRKPCRPGQLGSEIARVLTGTAPTPSPRVSTLLN